MRSGRGPSERPRTFLCDEEGLVFRDSIFFLRRSVLVKLGTEGTEETEGTGTARRGDG